MAIANWCGVARTLATSRGLTRTAETTAAPAAATARSGNPKARWAGGGGGGGGAGSKARSVVAMAGEEGKGGGGATDRGRRRANWLLLLLESCARGIPEIVEKFARERWTLARVDTVRVQLPTEMKPPATTWRAYGGVFLLVFWCVLD